MPIKRYFSDTLFPQVKKDFNFLVKFVIDSHGEYDLSIRKNYFNLYYKGNSMAKIKPQKSGSYRISMHTKFFSGTKADNPSKFPSNKNGKYYVDVILNSRKLHSFLQKAHVIELASRIKEIHSGEEIEFEQRLITDNLNREDLIIIDRQVTDTKLKRQRLDLLALEQIEGNRYKFIVVEVKLGNNKELEGQVAKQLNGYVDHISGNFDAYKTCYEKHYIQKKALGLISFPRHIKIEIIKPVAGIVLVGGYSGLAKVKIATLKSQYPQINIKSFFHEI